jgi:hypothetical protein
MTEEEFLAAACGRDRGWARRHHRRTAPGITLRRSVCVACDNGLDE